MPRGMNTSVCRGPALLLSLASRREGTGRRANGYRGTDSPSAKSLPDHPRVTLTLCVTTASSPARSRHSEPTVPAGVPGSHGPPSALDHDLGKQHAQRAHQPPELSWSSRLWLWSPGLCWGGGRVLWAGAGWDPSSDPGQSLGEPTCRAV